MLAKLVYKSTRLPVCTEQEVQDILKSAKSNNHEKDITGVLLYNQQNFIQYLEGESNKITTLYDKIKTDPRHKDVRMIVYGPLRERLFPSWAMGKKPMKDEVEFMSALKPEDQKVMEQILDGKELEDDRAVDWLIKFVSTKE